MQKIVGTHYPNSSAGVGCGRGQKDSVLLHSENFPRTYNRLVGSWEAKVGSMTWEKADFKDRSRSGWQKRKTVACLLDEQFKVRGSKIIKELNSIQMSGVQFYHDSFWIYNMRASDCLPRSNQDLQRLYIFVRLLLGRWFEGENLTFLEQNIHVSVSFVLWYLTKPNFFFKDKVHKQTTRHGITRVWTPLLLNREVKFQGSQEAWGGVSKGPRSARQTTNVNLGGWEKDLASKKKKIMELTGRSYTWNDEHSLHLEISSSLNDSELSINESKKLGKLYNELKGLMAKVRRTQDKISKVERENAVRQVGVAEVTEAARCLAEEVEEDPTFGSGKGEKADWKAESDAALEEEIPESWEDIEF